MAKKIVVNPHPTPKALASHMSITHIPLSARYSDCGTLCPTGRPQRHGTTGASFGSQQVI